ncbi:MAG: hypothetical protein KDI88_11575 [Gammaproteobacteria bacterium]|nr:hypothetical protein [Gammaproteobacteria bacterium]
MWVIISLCDSGRVMTMAASPYRRENGFSVIEIKLHEVRQLFNSLDPAPFHEKDLEAGAADYIVDSVRDLPSDEPVKLALYLPSANCDRDTARMIEESIHHYFDYRADVTSHELTLTLQQGRTALMIGLAFLFVCIVAQQLIGSMQKPGLLWRTLQEGFQIIGWVAMWKPLNVFLYEWWPIRSKRTLYRKLARVPVELRGY